MRTLITAALLLGTSAFAHAQATFIDDAVVVTADGKSDGTRDIVISENGDVRIGDSLSAPSGATTIAGENIWVTPGLFVPFSQVGLVDISLERATNDTRAGDATTSVANRAADAFNPKSVAVGNSRVEGVTHLATVASNSGNIFAGTGAIVSTSGGFDSILIEDAFVFASLGERGKGNAGGSRSAAMAQLRAAFADAEDVSRGSSADFGDVLTRADARALRQVLRGEMPLMVSVNRASDLLRIIGLTEEYPALDVIALSGSEAWQVADELADAGIKVLLDPHDNLPGSFESVGARADNAMLLDAAGVDYAFMTATADTSHNVRVISQHAGNAVGNGLDWDKAFAAISTTPRRWFGVEDNSLVVWVGDPLEVTSQPLAMFIDGEQVTLTSRQTALRDRYNPTSGDTRPHKYR